MKQLIYLSFFLSLFLFGCSSRHDNDLLTEENMTDSRDIIGNNAFLYYKNYDEATNFYGDILGFKNVFEFPDFATIFQTTGSTFITVVNDNGRGMHSSDEPKTIAIALVTDQLDGWYEYALSQNLDIKKPPKPLADNPHHAFLVTDPGGYILEYEIDSRRQAEERENDGAENDACGISCKTVHLTVDTLFPVGPCEGGMKTLAGIPACQQEYEEAEWPGVRDDQNPCQLLHPADRRVGREIVDCKEQ